VSIAFQFRTKQKETATSLQPCSCVLVVFIIFTQSPPRPMFITKLLAGMGSGSAFVNGHRVIVGPNSTPRVGGGWAVEIESSKGAAGYDLTCASVHSKKAPNCSERDGRASDCAPGLNPGNSRRRRRMRRESVSGGNRGPRARASLPGSGQSPSARSNYYRALAELRAIRFRLLAPI
jgi:hypothetical protein